jgi:autotransporter translocation and assembly factor TamB
MSGHGHFRGLARRTVSLAGTITGDGGRFQHPAKIVDLGLGGARLVAEQELPVGSSVRLSVNAPNRWDAIELEARVAWSRELGGAAELGVRFDHSTRTALAALVDLMVEEVYE